EHGSAAHALPDPHSDAPRLQVRVEGEPSAAEILDDTVPRRRPDRDLLLAPRDALGQVVPRRDDPPRRDGEDRGAVEEVAPVSAGVPGVGAPGREPNEVDGEALGQEGAAADLGHGPRVVARAAAADDVAEPRAPKRGTEHDRPAEVNPRPGRR